MKLSKNNPPKGSLHTESVSTLGMKPLDEATYPDRIETDQYIYLRFYVRQKFIVYEIVNHAQYIEGYLCISAVEQLRIEHKPYRTLWDEMDRWTNKTEKTFGLRPLAR